MRAIDADALKEDLTRFYDNEVTARKLIDEQPTIKPEPHWIPVTERLPEYGEAVLTVDKDGDFEINHVIDDEEGDFFYYGAVAWQPLPEPYKGVKE